MCVHLGGKMLENFTNYIIVKTCLVEETIITLNNLPGIATVEALTKKNLTKWEGEVYGSVGFLSKKKRKPETSNVGKWL